MQQEATEKLLIAEDHLLPFAVVLVVLPGEGGGKR
jgi:hypothetical protein